MATFIQSLQLRGFLSFGPESQAVSLTGLNVLIGPNGVGKSNFIEAIELLHAAPKDFSAAIRIGGLPSNWIWHGRDGAASARLEARLGAVADTPELLYAIEFMQSADRLEITDEILEDAGRNELPGKQVQYYYRLQRGRPVISVRQPSAEPTAAGAYTPRNLPQPHSHLSALSQIKDTVSFPEFSAVAERFGNIQIFREWSFGRSAALRAPQPANLPTDALLPQLVNLGLVLNELEQGDKWVRFNDLMHRFLPRFTRLTIKVSAGSVQIFLHEDGLGVPVPATRLSDGTLRFLALLAILLNAESSPLICIEEPELGMHPDAMSILVLDCNDNRCTE